VVFAISYDSQETLAKFADRNGITFHLLSDEGSRVIREVGVFDEELAGHQQAFGVPMRPDQWGVAYPITFVLDTGGRVLEKRMEENYRLRESGPRLVRRLAGDMGTPSGDANASETFTAGTAALLSDGPVAVRVALDGPTYFPYQRRDLLIDLRLEDGWHVYGQRAPEGCTALNVSIESRPAGVRVEDVLWPPPVALAAGGDATPSEVYADNVRVVVPITFVVERGSGDVVLDVAVDLQACDATRCRAPSRLRAELRVPEAPTP
jgi:AhpC/TSA family protein/cytochrome c biogenesis DsbD-like protein